MSNGVCRSLRTTLVAAVVVGLTLVLVVANPRTAASQSAERRAGLPEGRFACDPSSLWVSLLFDTSGSLKRTDPGFERRAGGMAAMKVLQQLQSQYRNVDIRVSVDSFAANYTAGDWINITRADESAWQRLRDATWQAASANNGAFTDYVSAMTGIARKMDEVTAESCKHVVWFTDGQHDTEENSPRQVTEAESAEVASLCRTSGVNSDLRQQNVWITSVHLASAIPEDAPETLRRLYDSGEYPCPNPLRGEIIKVTDIDLLAERLTELFEDLPFESLEAVPESEPCAVGRSSDGRCIYTFVLDAANESFEVFIDLKGLADTDLVNIELVPPSGSAALPLRFGSERREEHRTRFLLTASTSNWRRIEGHQAVTTADGRTSKVREWGGKWTLAFRGEDSHLARVTPPRFRTNALPIFEAEYHDSTDQLMGQIKYADDGLGTFDAFVGLRFANQQHEIPIELRPATATSGSHFAWAVSGVANRILEALDADDNESRASLKTAAGRISIQVSLVKVVDWPTGPSLRWSVPGTAREVSVPISVVAWAEESLHPQDVAVEIPNATVRASGDDLAVTAEPGLVDATIRLGRIDVHGQSLKMRATDPEWACDLAGGVGGRLNCPPLKVTSDAAADAEVSISFQFVSELQDYQRLSDLANAQGFAAAGKNRLDSEDHLSHIGDIRIVVAERSRIVWTLLLLLALYVAANACCRLISAARYRRWTPLVSDNYWSQRLKLADSSVSRSGSPAKAHCTELAEKRTRAVLGELTLHVAWLPSFIGREISIVASGPRSSAGIIVDASSMQEPRIREHASLGARLDDGWAAVLAGDGNEAQLYLWDVASDDPAPYSRIEDAVRQIDHVLRSSPPEQLAAANENRGAAGQSATDDW